MLREAKLNCRQLDGCRGSANAAGQSALGGARVSTVGDAVAPTSSGFAGALSGHATSQPGAGRGSTTAADPLVNTPTVPVATIPSTSVAL